MFIGNQREQLQEEPAHTKLDKIHTRLDTFEQKLNQIRSDVNIEGRVHDIEDKTSHLDHQQRDILRKIKPRTVEV